MNSQSAENHPLNADLTRRGALCAIAALSLGAIALPANPAVAATGVKVLRNGRIQVLLSKNPALKSVGGVVRIDGISGRSIALVRTGKGKKGYTALDLRCTHQGSIVEQDGEMWSCPNHGAAFALNGDLKIGPATSPLRKLRVSANSKRVVIS